MTRSHCHIRTDIGGCRLIPGDDSSAGLGIRIKIRYGRKLGKNRRDVFTHRHSKTGGGLVAVIILGCEGDRIDTREQLGTQSYIRRNGGVTANIGCSRLYPIGNRSTDTRAQNDVLIFRNPGDHRRNGIKLNAIESVATVRNPISITIRGKSVVDLTNVDHAIVIAILVTIGEVATVRNPIAIAVRSSGSQITGIGQSVSIAIGVGQSGNQTQIRGGTQENSGVTKGQRRIILCSVQVHARHSSIHSAKFHT